MTIKILLADDHKIIRDGLKSLIDNEPGMGVAAEARNGREAVKLAASLKPDIIIMDISMPDLNGIEATRQILSDNSLNKVIAFSMHSDKRFVVEMLRAGAMAYLLKDSAFEELVRAIKAVADGQIYLSPRITGTVIKDYMNQLNSSDVSESVSLTSREREVLQLIAEGQTTKQIASQLHVSVKTVETHRRQIMDKLKIHSIAELTKFAIREGLTTLEV